MKQFNGYSDARKSADYQGSSQLPVGAYVGKIMAVRTEEYSDFSKLVVQLDIVEGEHKDFFKKQYESNTSEDRKWKGRADIFIPKDDGSEKDGWTKNNFARWTSSLEKSNPGYAWDWDETKWKGKTIGLAYRNAGTVINDKKVSFTEVAFPCDAAQVRDGKIDISKIKPRYTKDYLNYRDDSVDDNGFVAAIPAGTDEEIPF